MKRRPFVLLALASVSGLALFASLRLPWTRIYCFIPPCPEYSGWESLRFVDVPIALLAGAAIVLAARRDP